DGRPALIVALIDGNVIHPHRVLLRHPGDVGKAHWIAVVENLTVAGCARRSWLRVARLVETDVFAGANRAINAPVRCRLCFGGIKWLAVRVLVVNHRSARTRVLSGRRRRRWNRTTLPTDAISANPRRNDGG